MTKKEKLKALETLHKHVNAGDTIHTVLRHASTSGMYRVIDVYVIRDNVPLRLSWSVAAAIGARYDKRHEGVGVSGCGMDMGFHIVYNLGAVLFPNGFACTGKTDSGRCQSCDHSNPGPNRDNYTPDNHHSNGGYALRHAWM